MKKTALFALVMFALILSACSPAASTSPGFGGRGEASPPMEMPAAEPAFSEDSDGSNSYNLSPSSERVVIKTASMAIVVADPVSAADTIGRMSENMGGFIVNSSVYKTTTGRGLEVPEASITVRVPAERLNEAMDQIRSLVENPSLDVLNESITGEDVTQQYTDLRSRLRNLEDAAEALRKILDEANRTEDVLSVYQELMRVTEQIEVLKGQIQFYEESSRLSAISVRIQSQEAVSPISVAGWTPVGVARDALQALVDALQWLANASIWLVVFCLPLGLLLGIPLYFIIRGARRYRSRRSTALVDAAPKPSE